MLPKTQQLKSLNNRKKNNLKLRKNTLSTISFSTRETNYTTKIKENRVLSKYTEMKKAGI